MRIKWQLQPIDGVRFNDALYGTAIDLNEREEPIKAWHYMVAKQRKGVYHLSVRAHGRTIALLTGYQTLRAAKDAAIRDAVVRLVEEAA